MKEELLNKAKLWQVEYKRHDYNPKYIFKNSETKIETLFSLSFFPFNNVNRNTLQSTF